MLISQETLDDFNKTISDFAEVLGRMFGEMAMGISGILADIDFSALCDYAQIKEAYEKAGVEHPEWARRAEYAKKKRIRKKYHDRIMREYGERME